MRKWVAKYTAWRSWRRASANRIWLVLALQIEETVAEHPLMGRVAKIVRCKLVQVAMAARALLAVAEVVDLLVVDRAFSLRLVSWS
uniref:Putative secreted protein n=1 Tax=Anopheles marajoara TaxID=58244 RepID=A0A2M4CAN0_9DIPT